MSRAYSAYFLSGTVVCAAVAAGAIIKGEYSWIIVGVGGSLSCLVYFLRGRRIGDKVFPNKSRVARWRERKNR
jgi:hypothetical protein